MIQSANKQKKTILQSLRISAGTRFALHLHFSKTENNPRADKTAVVFC